MEDVWGDEGKIRRGGSGKVLWGGGKERVIPEQRIYITFGTGLTSAPQRSLFFVERRFGLHQVGGDAGKAKQGERGREKGDPMGPASRGGGTN